MSKNEEKLLKTIRECKDPIYALLVAVDLFLHFDK